jgi:tetratricopeptide (TPR) repeat protein
MAYPGNPDLSAEAQERVLSAFRQVVSNLQQGQREEAQIGLEFVLRLDPDFRPAVDLHRQLSSGAQEINLAEVILQLEAPTTDAINELLVEAVEDFNQRNFLKAKEKVEKVLVELPGHQEARELLGQLGEALKVEQQVGQFLAQAHEALNSGDAEEAANFVTMAQALDPHHSGIAPTLQEIYDKGGAPRAQPDAPGEPAAADASLFSVDEEPEADFSLRFDELDDPVEQAPVTTPEPDPLSSGAAVALGNGTAPDAAQVTPQAEAAPPEDFSFPGAPEEMAEPSADAGGAAESLADAFEPGLDEPSPAMQADDLSDLFDAGPEKAEEAPVDEGDELQILRSKGVAAFEAGNFLAAIDSWSRIYLIDPSNTEIPARIEEAKKALEETNRKVEHLIFDAQDAEISGDTDKALMLANQILAVQPDHSEALEIAGRLSGEAPVAPPEAPQPDAGDAGDVMPDLEDDLFEEPFAEGDELGEATLEEIDWEDAPPVRRRLLALSGRGLAVVGVAVVLLMVAGWFGLRSMLGGDSDGGAEDVYALRAQAEELYKSGQAVQALRLVEQYEPADAAEEKVVGVLAAKYLKAIATPTPTPVPASFLTGRRLLDEGLWYRAYSEALAGLKAHPEDQGLQQLVAAVESVEPKASDLHHLIQNNNHQGAVGAIRDLMLSHPDQADLQEVFGRALFNAALEELRSYNLTGAESHLLEYIELDPNDAQVNRILEFISNYKARPVDMQLRVFIQSLTERRGWSKLPPVEKGPEEEPVATPTPAQTGE